MDNGNFIIFEFEPIQLSPTTGWAIVGAIVLFVGVLIWFLRRSSRKREERRRWFRSRGW
jgi:hypothetical protein